MASDMKRPPLTDDDLELLATPNAELQKKTATFSFDAEKFTERVFDGQRWQQLLQAHLYYDHVITRILSDALTNADAVNLRRIGFYQKSQPIRAMNLLPGELVSVLEFINSLRNKIAHE